MQVLNDQQILYLESRLTNEGLEHPPLQEELLDHVCCAVEAKMQKGIGFHLAAVQTLEAFGHNGIINIQENALRLERRKRLSQKLLLLLLLPLLFFGSYCWWAKKTIDVPDISPVAGAYPISSAFGERIHPIYQIKKKHNGVDISVPEGTPVVTTGEGVVIMVDENDFEGKKVVIKHRNQYKTVYAKLSKVMIEEGQLIKKGDLIALSGNTGLSTHPHLHYEVISNNEHIDPQLFMKAGKASSP